MKPTSTILLAMNALRLGGSQTLAISLAEQLDAASATPVFVAKRGVASDYIAERYRVNEVKWAEGTGDRHGPRHRAAQMAGWAYLGRLRLTLRSTPPSGWIASQPWPIHYAAQSKSFLWPTAKRIALIHGTTDVEMSFPNGVGDLTAMDAIFSTTLETHRALQERLSVESICLGNLFNADLFWREPTPRPLDHPFRRFLFLGTLGFDKTAPLSAVLPYIAEGENRQLDVVGDGPDRARLELDAQRLRCLDRIQFLGAQMDPRSAIETADVVITAGRGAIEAATCPRPVIVASTHGLHGPLTPQNLKLCQQFNFTGRTPGSVAPTPKNVASSLARAERLTQDDLKRIASSLTRVGDPAPLLALLGLRSPP
jgi:hypothetical protein